MIFKTIRKVAYAWRFMSGLSSLLFLAPGSRLSQKIPHFPHWLRGRMSQPEERGNGAFNYGFV